MTAAQIASIRHLHPLRIQRKRTKGFRLPSGTVCVTRPGRFGNPFHSASEFRSWLESGPADDPRRQWILENVESLRGKKLACWCPLDAACHADVLAALANEKSPTDRAT